MFDPRAELGVLRPVGFFDPLGFSKGVTEEQVNRWRTVEIKHGRVCMMAFLGCEWSREPPHRTMPCRTRPPTRAGLHHGERHPRSKSTQRITKCPIRLTRNPSPLRQSSGSRASALR